MKFDQLLFTYLGEFGRYQKIMFFLVCIPTIFTALHSFSWTFTAHIIPHRCRLPGETGNASFAIDSSLLPVDTHDPSKQASCSRFPTGTNDSREECNDGFIWDRSKVTNSAINRWTIVCNRAYIRAVVQSMFYIGQFFGSFVFGYLADIWGRKIIFVFCILLQITCGAAMSIVPFWELFGVLRMGLGFAHPGIFIIAVVIGVEMMGPTKRKLSTVMTHVCYELGIIVLGAVAFGIRDYQYLQFTISIAGVPMLLYWWLVPESPRWLVSKGKFDEADKILKTAAKMNKRTIPDDWRAQIANEEAKSGPVEKHTVMHLLGSNILRRRTLIVFFCWPVVSMTYYGISMNPTFLGGGIYFTSSVTAGIAIVGLLLLLPTIDRWGRRPLAAGGYLVTSLALFSTLVIPENIIWLRIGQIAISKVAITCTYCVMYGFTPEMFPTQLRSTATGCASMVARVGAVGASYIAMWLVIYSKLAMVLIFGCFTLTAGVLALFLPETAGKPLPESLLDAARLADDTKWYSLSMPERTQNGPEKNPEEIALENMDA